VLPLRLLDQGKGGIDEAVRWLCVNRRLIVLDDTMKLSQGLLEEGLTWSATTALAPLRA
jgi:hypothetical protein